MRNAALIVGLLMLIGTSALAEEASDLKQTISDLQSQAADKDRMDEHRATRVELSQVQGWLNDATNAVREEATAKCRRLFDLVRAQFKLIDELVALSKLNHQIQTVKATIAKAQQAAETAKGELENKKAKLRALKRRESE